MNQETENALRALEAAQYRWMSALPGSHRQLVLRRQLEEAREHYEWAKEKSADAEESEHLQSLKKSPSEKSL